MFTDNTYFIGEIMLPNLVGNNSNAVQLARSIDQYEE